MRGLIVEADSTSELVLRVLGELQAEGGDWEVVAPRGMPTRELRDCRYTLTDVSRCAAWMPGRRLNYAFMVAEFVWMFLGRSDVEMISYYNSEIAKFSDDGRTFWGAYGARWRDQVGGALHRLRTDHTTRQAVIGIWRPEYNIAMGWSQATGPVYRDTKDVPCTICMQYLLRNGRLSASVYMRSSDAWLGLAYDIFNFASLQRCMARELGVADGELTLHIGSSHLYERDLLRVREVVEGAKCSSDERSRLVIPTPPGIGLNWLYDAEESVRREGSFGKLEEDVGWVDWYPYLSMLGYRAHRDPKRVVGPFAQLVQP